MLSLSVLTLVAGAVAVAWAVSIGDDGHYDTRYNHLDIERILNNKRLVTYYGQCLTGEGPCTPQGTEFKRILPEALRTNCARCTEKQKITAYLAIRRLKKEYPKIWQQLQASWDSTGELVSTFINTVESKSSTPGASQSVNARFGDTDNEIHTAEAPATVPLTRGIPPSQRTVSSSPTTTTSTGIPQASSPTSDRTVSSSSSTITTTTSRGIPQSPSERTVSSARPIIPVTETNYRTSFRPNRFNLLLPRPQDFGKITVNWIGSIGDIGTKVIRTGARIADMVISGVQAGVQATIGRPLQ